MEMICEQLHRQSGAWSRLPSASSDSTVASCLDAYLPIYIFSTSRKSIEKPLKLSRVDSFPTVPDLTDEPTCDSPQFHGSSLPTYCPTGDDSFNSLPINICSHVQQQFSSPYDVVGKGLPYTQFGNEVLPSACSCADAGIGAIPLVDTKASLAPGRAHPRRHPSDVRLSRPGSMGSSLADDCSSYSAFSSSIAVSGSEDGKVLEVPSRSLLESALMTLWEDRADRGLFRYDVTLCPTRVLPGSRGFIAQLNEGRATKKRPTEVTLDRVLQPFDSAKFNFKKAAMAEALVGFFPDDAGSGGGAGGGNGGRSLLPSVAPLGAAAVAAGGSPNLVLINVSPIDYGHVLLVPRVLDNLPQALSCGTVLLALQFAGELGNSHFRVGYNSLGAYATINHLHFQSYFLAKTMPCEAAATVPLPGVLAVPPVTGGGGGGSTAALLPLLRKRHFDDDAVSGVLAGAAVRVSRLVDYPVNAFVIEALTSLETSLYDCGCGSPSSATAAVAAVVGLAAERLQAANQPFNLLISDAGRRVFLFPQCFAERQAAGLIPPELLETGVNPAAFEIAGHLVLKRTQDYTEATEDLAMQLLAQASLSEERFMSLARLCFGGAAGADICGAALQ